MKKSNYPIPSGQHTLTPYLIVADAASAIDFYIRAFNAKEMRRFEKPGGKIGHAELQIGDSILMLADEYPEYEVHGPGKYQGSPVSMHLYVEDVDSTVERAVKAGAELLRPVEDMFYGDRSGAIKDPYGHSWFIATHIEDLSDDEIRKRAKEMYG